ncbi:hypothetical protein [Herbaspirillum huttiense]|uniref:hypothetical protein n=1 Tax=Herbaspirillum huttiense TaxID=863372 RepID=UPI003B3BDB04
MSWNEGLTISIVSPYFFAIRHMLCRAVLFVSRQAPPAAAGSTVAADKIKGMAGDSGCA